jgi:hypothetical protein
VVKQVHKGVGKALEVISTAMVPALEGRYGASEGRPLEQCLILSVVTAILAVKVFRDNSEIYHPYLPLIVQAEIVQLDVPVDHLRILM